MKKINVRQIILILVILKSLTSIAVGQENLKKFNRSVFITGFTADAKTLEPLSNTNFKINHLISNTTNESGRFSFFGNANDTIVFSYLGYHSTRLIVPDTLKSEEYVMGVFMRADTVKLAEIIILPRNASTSIMIVPIKTDQNAMDRAQNNVDKAVVEGLTKAPKVYDADMNAKKTMRTNEMRAQYKGMLVTPENSVGMSTQSYKTFNVIFGSPITTQRKLAKEMITSSESAILQSHFEALKRLAIPINDSTDSVVAPKK